MKQTKTMRQQDLEACALGVMIVAVGVYIALVWAVVTVGVLR